MLSGPHSDGEPQRAYHQTHSHSGNGLSRTRRSKKDDPETTADSKRITLGGDKGYDTKDFVKDLREPNVTPHVAQNKSNRRSAIDGRTISLLGYTISQRIRKRIEEGFGWMKTVGRLRKTMYRGVEKIAMQLDLHAVAYNLVRMANLGLGTT